MILEAPLKDPKDLAEGMGGDCDYKDFLKLVMTLVWSTQNIAVVIVMLFFFSFRSHCNRAKAQQIAYSVSLQEPLKKK